MREEERDAKRQRETERERQIRNNRETQSDTDWTFSYFADASDSLPYRTPPSRCSAREDRTRSSMRGGCCNADHEEL